MVHERAAEAERQRSIVADIALVTLDVGYRLASIQRRGWLRYTENSKTCPLPSKDTSATKHPGSCGGEDAFATSGILCTMALGLWLEQIASATVLLRSFVLGELKSAAHSIAQGRRDTPEFRLCPLPRDRQSIWRAKPI